jgi:hypothetical protein
MSSLCSVYLDIQITIKTFFIATINMNQKKLMSLAYNCMGIVNEENPEEVGRLKKHRSL